MAAYSCPKGHASSEHDFCSECGAKISDGANSVNTKKSSTDASKICPDCQSPRPGETAVFCEVCGYNYQTGGHGEIPLTTNTASSLDKISAPSWMVVAHADPSLKQESSPDPPADLVPVSFKLGKESLLIGRQSPAREIFPDISLDFDSAVSHRHALLICRPGATLLLRDIGSSNGTRVNGSDIPPLTDVALCEGDRIMLGHWTCLTVQKVK